MRIAAIRIDKLGDAILTEPAIRALKNYRAEHLTLILSNYTYPLFKGYKYADEILALDPTKEGIQKLVNRLKDKEYDEVFVFTPRSKAYYLGTLLKAKRRYSLVYSSRVLAKVYWSFFYKFWIDPVDMAKPETYSRRPILHELQQNFKVLELVGIVPKDEDLELKIPITEEELEEGEEFWLPIDSPHLLVAVSDRIIDNEEVIRRIFLRLRKMGFRPVFSAHPSKADIIPIYLLRKLRTSSSSFSDNLVSPSYLSFFDLISSHRYSGAISSNFSTRVDKERTVCDHLLNQRKNHVSVNS